MAHNDLIVVGIDVAKDKWTHACARWRFDGHILVPRKVNAN